MLGLRFKAGFRVEGAVFRVQGCRTSGYTRLNRLWGQ